MCECVCVCVCVIYNGGLPSFPRLTPTVYTRALKLLHDGNRAATVAVETIKSINSSFRVTYGNHISISSNMVVVVCSKFSNMVESFHECQFMDIKGHISFLYNDNSWCVCSMSMRVCQLNDETALSKICLS